MTEKENSLLDALRDNIDTSDFEWVSTEIVEKIEQCENPFSFVEAILKFMESYPLSNFGLPGALVHFVEEFSENGYEELLYESVRRCPTLHTIRMVRRVINDKTYSDRQKFIELLIETRMRSDLDNEIKICIDKHLSGISTYS